MSEQFKGWSNTQKKDLFVHSANIVDGNDVFHAVVMGITVRLHTKEKLFVSWAESRERLSVSDILTQTGSFEYWESRVGLNGWRFLHFFCDFAQKNQRIPAERTGRLCKMLSARAAVVLGRIFFKKPERGKRKFEQHFRLDYTLHREWISPTGRFEFERLAAPVRLPANVTGTSADTDHIGDMLMKVKRGEFEDSGKLCHYRNSAQRSLYQNEKKRGDAVKMPTLSNEWACLLLAALKIRVTIWSHGTDTDDVEVSNNDAIIALLWRVEMSTDPGNTFDHLLMCRPNRGMLRAVRRYDPNWPQSHWSRLCLSDPGLIPATV
jgi:hypothetical protein